MPRPLSTRCLASTSLMAASAGVGSRTAICASLTLVAALQGLVSHCYAGQFVMLRPKAHTANGVDESTDSYDTIDWIVRSVPGNNGRVGVFGVSYLGWTTAMSTVDPHPALNAVSVQASPEDMYMGDDFHHNVSNRTGWQTSTAVPCTRAFQPGATSSRIRTMTASGLRCLT